VKGFGFRLIERVTTIYDPFDDEFTKDINANRWSPVIEES